jgi:hypothetical protein
MWAGSPWHKITIFHLKKGNTMNWMSLILRTAACIVSVLLILWWAETVMPMGSVIVLILVMCMISTWGIVTLLKDDPRVSRYP